MEQQWIPAVAMIAIVLVIGTTLVLRGPMPQAAESVLAEVDELKRRLAEVEERLDFTERLLARERDPERLAPPR